MPDDVEIESARVAKIIAATAERHKGLVLKAWQNEMNKAQAYLKIVLRNNPGTMDLAIERSDVQYIVLQAAIRAYEASVPLLEKAALSGGLLGHREAEAALKALGLPKPTPYSIANDGLLVSLHSDLQKIAAELPAGVFNAALNDDEAKLDAAFNRFSLRAQMVVEAAVKMTSSTALINAMQNTNTKKKWQTTSAVPCKFCQELNGQVKDWNEPFPIVGFPIYGPKLMGPQLHPNCRCVLIVVVAAKEVNSAAG